MQEACNDDRLDMSRWEKKGLDLEVQSSCDRKAPVTVAIHPSAYPVLFHSMCVVCYHMKSSDRKERKSTGKARSSLILLSHQASCRRRCS